MVNLPNNPPLKPEHFSHLDCDAFFASVEQASDARLRGRPVAVGGEKRGIIASCSYEARERGIYTPMPTALARRRCPDLVIVPGNYEKYEQFSRWVFSYAYDFTPDVEICSIDEGFLDLSHARKPAETIAETLRTAIRQSLKISVSEGVASNKITSQIASKIQKPNALVHVPTGQEAAFLAPLRNRCLPGIGPQSGRRLDAAGLLRIGQIAATDEESVSLLLGSRGPGLRQLAQGIDPRPIVRSTPAAKSYSHQHTFDEDVTDSDLALRTLYRMADDLTASVRREQRMIRTLEVRIRYNDFTEDRCSESLTEPTDLESDLYPRIRILFKQAWRRRVSLRLVSLKLSNLYDGFREAELGLFADSRNREARRRLAGTLDQLHETLGRRVLVRGHDLPVRPRPPAPASTPRPARLSPSRAAALAQAWTPLHIHSTYSFLDSTLSIEDIVREAARLEIPTLALTDRANLHGAVPFMKAAIAAGLRPVLGTEVQVEGKPLLLYVQNTEGYRNLSQLLTAHPSGCGLEDLGATQGLIAVGADPRVAECFSDRFYLGGGTPGALRDASGRGLPRVAVPRIHTRTREDRRFYNILQSIRTGTLVDQPHPEKRRNRRLHFVSPRTAARAFADVPDAVFHTREIAESCSFDFEFGRLQFPAFHSPDGSSAHNFLRERVQQGMRERYRGKSRSVRERIRRQIDTELEIIAAVGYEDYFLLVWDLLQTCARRGISWITRGSAADSLVCYCLGISNICPLRYDLYFQRFLNPERMKMNKLPDIDIDFPHDRKDDVIDLLFEKYGPDRAAVVGGFSTCQSRSALGEIAKTLGVSEHQIRQITRRIPRSHARHLDKILKNTPGMDDLPTDEEPYRTAFEAAHRMDDMPRYAKMHPCGVVLSRDPITHLTPCFTSGKGYPTTQFDMDAVEAVGLVKIDILAQAGLSVMRDTCEAVRQQRGEEIDLVRMKSVQGPELRARTSQVQETRTRTPDPRPPTSDLRPQTPDLSPPTSDPRPPTSDLLPPPPDLPSTPDAFDDPSVWDMIAGGQARAVHHIESPAMISLARMCNVRDIDTLIAMVSVIRPGAANQHKKRHFTRRYQGLEETVIPHPVLRPALESTYGMIVYEEQILRICADFAGLDPGTSDRLRRALVKEHWDTVHTLEGTYRTAAREQGRSEPDIDTVWKLLCGFCGYAFCKAHSAAYGVEAYQSAWLKRYYPEAFMAAVLTQGKGFYHPLVYVLECLRLGLRMRPPSVQAPGPGYQAGRKTVRVPLEVISGLSRNLQKRIHAERQQGAFESLRDFFLRTGPLPEDTDLLLRSGALDDFGGSRTALFWETRWLHEQQRHGGCASGTRELLPPPDTARRPATELSEPTELDRLRNEMELFGFTVSAHPLALHPGIRWNRYCPVSQLARHVGRQVRCCGLVIEERVTQQIGGEPMKFMSIADWSGIIETELFARTYRRHGAATHRHNVLEVIGRVEPFENGRGHTLRVQAVRPVG